MKFPICSVCPLIRSRKQVLPSGPPQCKILFVGEAPSKHEDASGRPFADRGQTGMEFNDQYLPLAQIHSRDAVAVCNPILCSQQNYRNPKPKEAQACASRWLPEYIRQVNPQVIVTMGGVSASLFPGTNLNIHHGIPQKATYGDWEGILFPTFHPAFGLRSTAAMIPLRRDFEALGQLLKALEDDTFEWPEDPHPSPDYRVIRTMQDLNDYLPRRQFFYEISEDTENRPDGSPYCLTFSHTPGTGRLVYSSNESILRAYNSYLHRFCPLMPFHNWMHDADIREKMGLTYTRFSDTMIRAYELGIGGGGDDDDASGGAARGSLGLKTLAYRHLNMQMTSFKDTCRPHAIPHVLRWLHQAHLLSSADESPDVCECGHEQGMHEARGKTQRAAGPCLCGSCSKWKKAIKPKPHKEFGMTNRKIKGLIKALEAGEVDSDGDPINPWKRVKEWHERERGMLEGMLGPMPVMDVGLVPEGDLLRYACQDADSTLRLHYWLNRYKIR